MGRARVGVLLIAVASAVLLIVSRTTSGSVRSQIENGEWVYRTAQVLAWTSGVASALFLAAAVLIVSGGKGWFRLGGIGAALLGILLGLATIDAATDHLVVGPERLVLPGVGIGWRPHYELRTADVVRVEIRRTGRKGDREMELVTKSGRRVVVPMGDLLREAKRQIAATLAEHYVVWGERD